MRRRREAREGRWAWNVKGAFLTSPLPTAQRMLAEIGDAHDREHQLATISAFAHEFGAKWPQWCGDACIDGARQRRVADSII